MPLRVVGEVFKTYIITERGNELCLIDKHAAHERILFEQLARDYGSVPSQMLLVPVQVNLTAAEKQALWPTRNFCRTRYRRPRTSAVLPLSCVPFPRMCRWTM